MPYPGGKGSSYQKLINLMPPHSVYIESHLGSGAVMQNKRPAVKNYGIDLDPDVIRAANDSLARDIASSIAESGDASASFTFIEGDAVAWLRAYADTTGFTGNELVYCDPPYVMASRKQDRRRYRFEYTDKQHRELLDCLRGLPCKVMISGYASSLYRNALKEWHVFSFQAQTRGGSLATEYVWMNYPQPVELHDYTHLGENFRERERIKRKKTRWMNRLQSLPTLERQALLAAMQECDFLGHNSPSS